MGILSLRRRLDNWTNYITSGCSVRPCVCPIPMNRGQSLLQVYSILLCQHLNAFRSAPSPLSPHSMSLVDSYILFTSEQQNTWRTGCAHAVFDWFRNTPHMKLRFGPTSDIFAKWTTTLGYLLPLRRYLTAWIFCESTGSYFTHTVAPTYSAIHHPS